MAPLNDLQILVTAGEGYRAFERAVAGAHTRIDMGFRVFDARMDLLSDAGRQIGSNWFDLLLAKLNDGVDITIRISDFDPVARPQLHRASYKSLSVLMGIAEMTTGPGRLRATVEAHPARVGWAPRLAFWPKVQSEIRQFCDRLNEMTAHERREVLRFMPRLTDFISEEDGSVHPRRSEFPNLLPVTHHQKLAVIDDEILYVGGLDLDERRFDTKRHNRPTQQTWHDVHVLVKDANRAKAARRHLDRFRAECAGEIAVEPPKGLLRTLSVRRKDNGSEMAPEVRDTGILDRTLELIDKTERLIYIENQFIRDPVVAEALCDRARENPDIGLILLVPAAPLEVAYEDQSGLDHRYGEYLQAKNLRQLQDAFGDRTFCASPAKPCKTEISGRSSTHGAPMIFVHSKVAIFDDRAGLVTSANLNGRSMRWDTEVGIEIDDPAQVEDLRERVMKAWLPTGFNDAVYWASSLGTVALWRNLAQENAAASPSARRGFLLPHDLDCTENFGTALPGIPVEMV